MQNKNAKPQIAHVFICLISEWKPMNFWFQEYWVNAINGNQEDNVITVIDQTKQRNINSIKSWYNMLYTIHESLHCIWILISNTNLPHQVSPINLNWFQMIILWVIQGLIHYRPTSILDCLFENLIWAHYTQVCIQSELNDECNIFCTLV